MKLPRHRWPGPPVTGPIVPIDGDVRDIDGLVLFNDLDSAVIGTAKRGDTVIAVYDIDKCIEAFVAQGMSEQEADEWFWFNVEGAYVGEGTPAFA